MLNGELKANSFVTPNGQVSAYDQYLFAQDPTGPAARDYFVPDNQLPPLIQVALIHHLLQHCHTKEVKVIKASLKSLTAETWMLHMLT